MMTKVRRAAVAGTFYPSSREELNRTVEDFLSEVETPKSQKFPKGLIVPHAGYIYSGPIAATAYAILKPFASQIRRVILLGPAHRFPVRGLALSDAEWFETPLGNVEVDLEATRQISKLSQVKSSLPAHESEHSLEVQLPFLQKVLTDFKVVPLVVGDARPESVAEVVEMLWGGLETIFVVSSDLSHYLPYELARKTDRQTVDEILKFDVPIAHDCACGATPINGFLVAAQKHHLKGELLDLRNSGDTAGDRRQVVGYSAFAFTDPQDG